MSDSAAVPPSKADPRLVGNVEGNQKLIREDRDAIREKLTTERVEPLHVQMQRAAYRLVCIPRPDRPLTDDQAADVYAAAHLMMRAAYRLEDAEDRLARRKTTEARRDRIIITVFVVLAVAWLVACAVGITLDATH